MKLFELKTTNLSVDAAVARVAKLLKEKQEPICLLLVGMPATGKSTFIRKLTVLASADGAVMLPVESTDAQVEAAAKQAGLSYKDFMAQNFTKSMGTFLKNVENQVIKHVKNGQGFIIDQTLLKREFRAQHLGKLTDRYYKVCLTFELDEKLLADRLADREKRTGKHIPPEVLAKMKADYQPPDKAEGFDELIYVR